MFEITVQIFAIFIKILKFQIMFKLTVQMQRLPGQGRDELFVSGQRPAELFPGFWIPQANRPAFVAGRNLKVWKKSKWKV